MFKKTILVFLVLAVAACLLSVGIRNAFLFILSYNLLLVAIYLTVLLALSRIIWRILPDKLQKVHKSKLGLFDAKIIISVSFPLFNGTDFQGPEQARV